LSVDDDKDGRLGSNGRMLLSRMLIE